jgi:leader peptidase (prepilin peptidase)/N-methyltransferase
LVTALLFAFCFLKWGFSAETLKYCTLSFLLLGLIFTDLDCKLLPDKLTLPGLGLGLLFSIFAPVERLASAWIPFVAWQHMRFDVAWRVQSLIDSAAGAALGAGLIWGAGFVYLKLRGVEGMGFGDVKMMALIGAFLGMEMTLFTIGAAALAATLFGLSTMLWVWIKRIRRRMRRTGQPLGVTFGRAWRSANLVYRNYEIPFGSFLGAMALLAFFYGNTMIQWYMHLWLRW